MQLTTVALFLFAAMGAVASPIESVENGLDARAEAAAQAKYTGTCTRSKNECRYKNDRGKTTFIKCPTKIANKRCTRDGAKCTVDTYNNSVDCD
ncbi:hypothetical protein N7517_003919 [Penicillium concentricum]|uniref:Antifungal protein n=1 Tax=Penicillium concentricum TaxID=293559 RepID=A0A9W9S4H9_9EURO|nr:uncharacterized protein N7517_003919 [Penicillium concentricum]KAJ5371913.1 hypothetical protein N7517_003919 [Penicillium concentricum]